MSIVEFLEARIAEDEAVAQESALLTPMDVALEWDTDRDYGETYLMVNPARVLAECKAKRQILAAWELTHHNTLLAVLYMMAGIYSDHPDCAWRADA